MLLLVQQLLLVQLPPQLLDLAGQRLKTLDLQVLRLRLLLEVQVQLFVRLQFLGKHVLARRNVTAIFYPLWLLLLFVQVGLLVDARRLLRLFWRVLSVISLSSSRGLLFLHEIVGNARLDRVVYLKLLKILHTVQIRRFCCLLLK